MAAVLTITAAAVACGGSGVGRTRAADPPSADEVSVWFPRIVDAIQPCDTASRRTRDAIYAFAAKSNGSDTDSTIISAAGDGFEQCSSDATPELHPQDLSDVPPSMFPLIDRASAWLEAMAAANEAILLAAASNLDNRNLVAIAFDRQDAADEANDAVVAEVVRLADALGVALPDGQRLMRWDPPAYN